MMFDFIAKKPVLGIEITSSAARLAALSGRGPGTAVLYTKTINLPEGLVNESYALPNISRVDELTGLLRDSLSAGPVFPLRRAALSLPDSVFRVQTLEFDDLPGKIADRERVIRWRLEKSAFDTSDSVLRHQVLKRRDGGITVLACLAKTNVIAQYEEMLTGLGVEPWSVGPSSFHELNFYASYLLKASPVAAIAHVSEDSFTTIVSEGGNARFYRFKEIKRGRAGEAGTRLMREIDDSLHFYMHMDRSHQAGVERLYLTGDAAVSHSLREGLPTLMSLEIEILSPAAVLPAAGSAGPELAAALGAGCSL